MKITHLLCYGKANSTSTSLGLLILRVSFGLMMLFGHGLGKLQNFSAISESGSFPVPASLSFLSPTAILVIAILAEFFGALLIILGLGTRLASLSWIAVMGGAAFLTHQADPIFAKAGPSKELALVYLFVALVLFIAGSGRYSVDKLIKA